MQVKKQLLEPDMEKWTGSKLGKEYVKAILSPCFFNLYAEYIMQNAGLDEAQAGIKIARRNINNLRYEDDTTLMTESEEEMKRDHSIRKQRRTREPLDESKRGEWKSWLKTQHSEN